MLNKNIPYLKAYNPKKLKTGFLVDRILRFFSFKKNKRQGYNETPSKILIVQSHLIGDLMMAIPLLKALRKKYPQSGIHLLANSFAREILEGSPYVDVIRTAPFPWGIKDYSISILWKLFLTVLKLRRERFDLAIDAQIDFRNAFLLFLTGARRRLGYDIVGGNVFLTDIPDFPKDVIHLLEGRLSLLKYLGIDTADKRYELPVSHDDRMRVEKFLQENGINGKVVIAVHPGASVPEKLWRADRFAAVIDCLYDKGFCPVLVEGPEDGRIVDEICSKSRNKTIRLKTGLKNVAAFFERSSLVICLDSAAAHFAAAVDTSAVVLYGPQPPEIAKPFGKSITAVWKGNMPCQPCVYNGCRQCKNNINECMERIQADDVLSAVEGQMKNNKADGVVLI